MVYLVEASYNNAAHGQNSLAAFPALHLSYAEGEEPVTEQLVGRRVFWRNVEHRSGTFATLRGAVEALYRYTDAPFAVHQRGPAALSTDNFRVRPVDDRPERGWSCVATAQRGVVWIAEAE